MTHPNPDVAIMAAIITQHCHAFYDDVRLGRRLRLAVDPDAVRKAAQALAEAGFRLLERPVDDRQDDEIEDLEDRVHRLEGWTGQVGWSGLP